MKSIREVLPHREPEWMAEPLHVFGDRSGTGVELHVYADHLELHSARGKEVLALWYRHIRAFASTSENGSEALAIIERGGQVLVVPMARDQVTRARWLLASLIE